MSRTRAIIRFFPGPDHVHLESRLKRQPFISVCKLIAERSDPGHFLQNNTGDQAGAASDLAIGYALAGPG
ncbi:MAG: hypothetical protein SWQ30_18350 [Thermodesulfobacteriota bacterium]|nr:hypothetical protein [Thermodesulfobacteriota bacterium]